MEEWTSHRSSSPINSHNVLVLSSQTEKQQDSVQNNGPSSIFGDPWERTGTVPSTVIEERRMCNNCGRGQPARMIHIVLLTTFYKQNEHCLLAKSDLKTIDHTLMEFPCGIIISSRISLKRTSTSLVPKPLSVFQCCMLKCTTELYVKSDLLGSFTSGS